MIKLNYYETEQVTICPYCGDLKENEFGCCGESSAHYETVILHQDETYSPNEVELYRPIVDVIRYELNRQALKLKIRRFKRTSRDLLRKSYDGQESTCRKLRQLTGFQWTKLDCFILRQLHDFPIYYMSPKQLKLERQESVKMMRDAWSRGEMLGCNLFPKIGENE